MCKYRQNANIWPFNAYLNLNTELGVMNPSGIVQVKKTKKTKKLCVMTV